MKKIFVLIFLASVTNMCNGQTNYFAWTDSIFTNGSSRNVWFYFALDGPCTVAACYTDCDTTNAKKKPQGMICYNKYTYDTIVDFLKNNPSVKIEIRFNTSQLGSDKYNMHRTQKTAKHCLMIFEQLGADIKRIKTVGKGESNPMIPESEILKIKDKEKRFREYFKNNRTEIVIIE